MDVEFEPTIDAFVWVEADVVSFLEQHRVAERPAFVAKLVVEEVVRNLIEHGSGVRRIRLRLALDSDRLTIRVDDDGESFDLRTAPEPVRGVPLAERSSRGMGIGLICKMVDEIDYDVEAGKNRLELRIGLGGAEE